VNQSTIQGFRAGMNEEFDYKGRNRELLERQRKLKKMVRVIRAMKCLNTRGKFCTKEYKRLRKHMSDQNIVDRCNEIREELGMAEVRKYRTE